jgi:hypothetical protein
MTAAARLLCIFVLLSLSACFKTELGGSVAGATVTITDLRSGAVAQDNLSSLTQAEFIANRSQEEWDKQGDLGKQLNLGNFTVDKDNFTAARWYLVTVTGGSDLDADGNRRVDGTPSQVGGTWHALMQGSQLRSRGFYISPLTDALYRSVRDDIPQLSDTELEERLNSATRAVLSDVNGNGTVGYADALAWTTLLFRNRYQLDLELLLQLADAVRMGANENTLDTLAEAALREPGPDAQQFFNANISMPIVQAKCVNCHTQGGIAPARGARLVVVTNSNSNHMQINHQAFISLGEQLGSRDLSDYVTDKALGLQNHGGGRQLTQGSQDLANLETYLNLIE